MALLYRDTDKDWQQIGDDNPFWGVLTAPQFHRDALTPESIETFYASGVNDMEWLAARVERHFGRPLTATRALDFGCGVGRLTRAMRKFATSIVGLDVSPGMLARAREVADDTIRFQSALTDEQFDWLHSFIVFQHIPPARGMAILRDLLGRLLPGGWLTLHFTVARTEALKPRSILGVLRSALSVRFRKPGLVSMFDYDLGALVDLCYRAGIENMTLIPTDHDGHKGVFILGQRQAGPDVPASAVIQSKS